MAGEAWDVGEMQGRKLTTAVPTAEASNRDIAYLTFIYIGSLSVLFFASFSFFVFNLLATEQDNFCRKRLCAIASTCFVTLVSIFPYICSVLIHIMSHNVEQEYDCT